MKQASQPSNTSRSRVFPVRLLWPLLGLLLGLVVFFEFIADVGGSAGPRPSPPERPHPLASPTPSNDPFPDRDTMSKADVIQVIDGDTLIVRLSGEDVGVRYYGVDAPDRGLACYGAAKEANRKIVGGQTVRLLSDAVERDEEGFLLRHVFLEDGRSVEALLATRGLVRARRENGTYQSYFIDIEETARDQRVGCLWSR